MPELNEETVVGYDQKGNPIEAGRLSRWVYDTLEWALKHEKCPANRKQRRER